MVDLSIVIVNWNVGTLVLRCLATLHDDLARSGLSAEVFVVDNASTDGSASRIAGAFPRVQLITNAENVGFVRANNQALRHCGGRYVLLLNPDTEVEPGAVGRLVACADSSPSVGVVGPRLRYPERDVQPSRRRFPTLATLFVESTVVQRWLPRLGLLADFSVVDRPDDVTQDVDWLIGACLLVRREAIERVGFLDERFFMYSEEVDWCHRIKDAGWRIVYLPEAVVVHHEARSSAQNVARRNVVFNESKCRYAGKYFGRRWEIALRAFLLATTLYQLAEEGAKLAIGHKRQLRRERLSMLGQVARWQLHHLGSYEP
ncbi:MAG: glycosyltransferase family 2 protein [Chloroflexi bacterium]|nr:glycosyltransferase family 2 protein [Chloroflexota bacterium]